MNASLSGLQPYQSTSQQTRASPTSETHPCRKFCCLSHLSLQHKDIRHQGSGMRGPVWFSTTIMFMDPGQTQGISVGSVRLGCHLSPSLNQTRRSQTDVPPPFVGLQGKTCLSGSHCGTLENTKRQETEESKNRETETL
ncbi:hypothetical protein DPEC_G00318590 [Dallia pectoralis]|uniref:Uncharacterized protein n=1 Tax=Dallia pectoralis TaxID=75939 RepID=A0ACC2F977_DALPE|nr:hypothetical protein DPEC_G00318590 [Dallia pectoralis]